jgi:hypothetical protein
MTHPDLKVTRRQATVRPRESTHFCGLSPPRTLGTFCGDINTMASALLERMYFCRVDGELKPPLPVDDLIVDQRCGWFADGLVSIIPSFTPVSLWDFSQMYKGPKKVVYERAVQSLYTNPVRRRDAESNSFVKREKAKFRKAPRCIQPRDPRYNASIGRYLKPLEHHLYRAVATLMGEGAVITKGLNLIGVAGCLLQKWNNFKRPVALGLDATAFDAHVSPSFLRWEHSIYNRIFKSDNLAKYLTWQIYNRGKSFCPDGKLKYRVEGRRFSGDMNTGLGNCLIMCSMVYSYASHRGIKINLANNGDDCVVFMEQEDLDRFVVGINEWFAEMGFRLTSEPPAYNFEAIEFCQMHPVLIGDEWRMVRTPKIAFEKDTMCTLTVSDEEYLLWLAGVSECGLSTASGVPVMQEFYLNLRMAAGDRVAPERLVENTGMKHLSRGMSSKVVPVDETSRYSFWLAFGVDPETQIAIEKDLQRCRSTSILEGFVPTHWALDASTPSNYPKQKY